MRKIKKLESRIEVLERTVLSLCGEIERLNEAEDSKRSELLQEGIDNIMAYEWPPKRGE